MHSLAKNFGNLFISLIQKFGMSNFFFLKKKKKKKKKKNTLN